MSAHGSRPYVAPELVGYTFEALIGQGGYADVFRYREHRPAREVAVKVLIDADVDSEARRLFDAEAEVMAQLGSHPSIVSIYKTDVGPDGRPYLVMEMCAGPSLAERYRQERVPVPEVLEMGISVSAAVETAHRAGILHRDVKPHNILTDAYGQPKLTDFGIAVVSGETPAEAGGLSVPWSPPEMLGDVTPEDPRSDVYSLAATVYTLLAGRSPFEVAGGANDAHTLIRRIERLPLPGLTRADVPARLNEVLDRGMAKRPEDRYPSAMAFARALQDVQISMHLAPTKIQVLDASPQRPTVVEEDNRTRVRPITVIVPDAPPAGPARITFPAATSVDGDTAANPWATSGQPQAVGVTPEDIDQTRMKRLTPAQLAKFSGVAEDTLTKESPAEPETQVDPVRTGPRRLAVIGGVLVAVAVAAVVGLGLLMGSAPAGKPASLASREHEDAAGAGNAVPAVTSLIGRRVGNRAEFSWRNPQPKKGDFYTWSLVGLADTSSRTVRTTALSFVPAKGSTGCVQVTLVRADGQYGPAAGPACPRGGR